MLLSVQMKVREACRSLLFLLTADNTRTCAHTLCADQPPRGFLKLLCSRKLVGKTLLFRRNLQFLPRLTQCSLSSVAAGWPAGWPARSDVPMSPAPPGTTCRSQAWSSEATINFFLIGLLIHLNDRLIVNWLAAIFPENRSVTLQQHRISNKILDPRSLEEKKDKKLKV